MTRAIVFILGVLLFAGDLLAQNEENLGPRQKKNVQAGSPQKKKSAKQSQPKSKKTKTVPLLGPDGKPVEVPLDANLQDYLNWLKTKKGSDFAINSISLSGTAKDKYALLQVTLTIQLLRDSDWVKVPLTLTEGVLRDSKYEGKGEASFDKFSTENGYSWWFRGQGYHKLILDLTVPITNANSSRRLQLTLPPRTAASSLKLKVPFQKIKTEFGKDVVVETKGLDPQNSEIEAIGLGERIDGRWTPVREASNLEPVFKVHSSIVAKLSLDTAVLRVKQRVETIQGSFDELLVQIPSSFEVLQVEGAVYLSHQKVSDRAGWYLVKLSETQTETVTLEWTLQSIFDRSSKSLIDLQGFGVEDAVRETGEIAVVLVDGIRVLRSAVLDQFVYRTRQSEFRDTDFLQASTPTETYAFLKQPFRFSRRIEEIKPFLSVTPSGTVELDSSEAKLTATYRCEIRERKGVVREIPLRWANWKKHGWVIQAIESQGLFADATNAIVAENEVHLFKLRQPQNADFEFTIRAVRKIQKDEDRFEIDFPHVIAPKTSSLNLNLKIADDIEMSLSSSDNSKQMEFFRQQGQRQYRIDPGIESLTFQFSVHAAEVVGTNHCSVGIDKDRLDVLQRITHEIRYFRTSELRLSVPEELVDDLKIFLQDDSIPLQFQQNEVDFGSMKQVSVSLPNPTIGTVELLLRYSVKLPRPATSDSPSECEIEFVKSAECKFDHTRLVFRKSDRYRLLVKDPNWNQDAGSNGMLAWEISQDVSRVNLELSISELQTSQHFSVKRALVTSSLNRDGSSFHRVQFLISGFPSHVELNWPNDAKLLGVWWNQEKIAAENIRWKSESSEIVAIDLPFRDPFSEQRSFLLTVDYNLPQNRTGKFFVSRELQFPVFPPSVWIEQTRWIVRLPADLHLGQAPAQLEADFRWQREGLVWKRTPRTNRAECGNWISAERGPASVFDATDDSFYFFARQGNLEALSVTTISRAKMIFLGAGFALLAGFLLLRVNRMQNILVVLSVCFLFSFLGIWFSEWMQLLIQPALLGMLLASLAVGIDTFIRRRKTSVVMTVPGNKELHTRYVADSSDARIETNQPVSSTVTNAPADRLISESPLKASDFSTK